MTFMGVAHATEAFAQTATGTASGGLQQILGSPMILLVAMLAIFYFLLIRPQQKRQKEHNRMLSNLQKGDTIFTVGGLRGRITNLDETVVTMEVAEKIRVKVNRSSIGGLVSKGESSPEKESNKDSNKDS
ncbi:MAG: preprotein translocase subunit YajC [Syntrophobacteraceae bacterium]|nr:preprotein translocase subunit YajC [Syntrophobacteraceae bacterium]